MNKILISLLMLGATIFTASCASENQKDEPAGSKKKVEVSRKARYFSQINVLDLCNVHFTQAETPSIKIVGREDMVNNIQTIFDGETLTIKMKRNYKNFFRNTQKYAPDVYVSSPDLIEVTLRGAGDFEVDKHLNTDDLKVELSGAGDVHFADILCDCITVELRGVGDVNMDNVQCEKAELSLMGTGDLDAKLVKAKRTNVSLIGVGDIDVDFDNCGSASAQLTGSGSITLKGKVKSFSKSRTGTGDIDTDNLVCVNNNNK